MYLDGEITVPPVTPDRVVDSHGAGDIFAGGLTEGILEGKTVPESAIMATVCASFSLEHYGTQGFSFGYDEFNKRLENLKKEMNWI